MHFSAVRLWPVRNMLLVGKKRRTAASMWEGKMELSLTQVPRHFYSKPQIHSLYVYMIYFCNVYNGCLWFGFPAPSVFPDFSLCRSIGPDLFTHTWLLDCVVYLTCNWLVCVVITTCEWGVTLNHLWVVFIIINEIIPFFVLCFFQLSSKGSCCIVFLLVCNQKDFFNDYMFASHLMEPCVCLWSFMLSLCIMWRFPPPDQCSVWVWMWV